MSKPLVSIVMGSDSDLEIMREAGKALDGFGIAYEIDVTSAHRSPDRTAEYARKAAERGLSATFRVQDALTLDKVKDRFNSAIDSGLFHVFSDADRKRYVDGLATVLKPGGRLQLADIALGVELPEDARRNIDLWTG